MLTAMQPTHMVRIKPLSHPLFWMTAPVKLRRHEPGEQQEGQADHKVNHWLSHGSPLIRSRPCLYSRSCAYRSGVRSASVSAFAMPIVDFHVLQICYSSEQRACLTRHLSSIPPEPRGAC